MTDKPEEQPVDAKTASERAFAAAVDQWRKAPEETSVTARVPVTRGPYAKINP